MLQISQDVIRCGIYVIRCGVMCAEIDSDFLGSDVKHSVVNSNVKSTRAISTWGFVRFNFTPILQRKNFFTTLPDQQNGLKLCQFFFQLNKSLEQRHTYQKPFLKWNILIILFTSFQHHSIFSWVRNSVKHFSVN